MSDSGDRETLFYSVQLHAVLISQHQHQHLVEKAWKPKPNHGNMHIPRYAICLWFPLHSVLVKVVFPNPNLVTVGESTFSA